MASQPSSKEMAKQSRHGPRKGIPYKPIDWDKVDQYIIQGCNAVQVAALIGISTDTLYLRCSQEKNTAFPAYFQEKRETGNSYIHQAQYQKALKEKNTTMLIWLGKQRCGQRDHDESKEAIPPQDAIVDRDNENMELKAEKAALQIERDAFRAELNTLREKIDHLTKARQELS